MKTFIFLLILIIGLYYVIFTQKEDAPAAAQTEQISMPASAPAPTLEAIETIGEDHVSAQAAGKPPKSAPAASSTPANHHSLPTIEEDMTFLQLKSIIHTINPRYPQQRITLNSSITSLLPTQAARERFAREISAQFAISERDARNALGQKRLLWDWVNLFRE